MSSIFLFTFVAIIVTLAIHIGQYNRRRKRLVDMMNKFDGPKTIPVFGNALMFATSTKEIVQRGLNLTSRYQNPIRLWLFNIPYVIVTDPEDFQIVANKVIDKDDSYRFLIDFIGHGLVTAQGSEWKKFCKIMNPIFSRTILYGLFMDIFNRNGLLLIQLLESEADTNKHFNVMSYVFKTFFTIVNETATGYNEDLDNTKSLSKFRNYSTIASKLIGKRFYQPWLRPNLIFNLYKYLKGYETVFHDARGIQFEIIKKKEQEYLNDEFENRKYNETDESYKNLIDVLLRNREENRFNDEEIVDNIMTYIFAATDSSASITCFTLLMLAMNPDIQDIVHQEISNVLQNNHRFITIDNLLKLTFLEQCVKESMRLFSVVPAIIRNANEDIAISNDCVIPAGVNIILPIIAVHMNPKFYPNPQKWNPYNFDEDKVADRHPSSFVPFGAGPRICPGSKQSTIVIKILLSMILQKFYLSTDETSYEFEAGFLLRNARGFKIKLYRR